MLMTVACAVLVCIGAPALGQGVLALCGARSWNWAAPALGISVMMLIAIPGLYVPGRSMTMAVVLGLAVGVAVGGLAANGGRAHLPPVLDALAGVPVFLLALLPFAAAGHHGTLGVSFNNDMASHLLLADAHRSAAVAAVNPVPSTYPLGPHSLVAALTDALGTTVDVGFAGLLVALPVLLGWTALALLAAPRRWAPFAVAPLVGMTYLVAGYYGQGSFKEVMQAVLILASAALLARPPALAPARRWIPMAVLFAGIVSVFSHLGLAWPLLFIAAWAVVRALPLWRRGGVPAVLRRVRADARPVLVAAGLLVVVLAPQLPRTLRFVGNTAGNNLTGLDAGSLGNLAGPLPFWQAFGVWDSPDYRLGGTNPFGTGMWVTVVLGLALFGVVWCLRNREWMLPVTAGCVALIWLVSDHTQGPYVAAKALVFLAPFAILLALRPLVERDTPGVRMPSWWRYAAPAIALVLAFKAIGSSADALTYSKVGPTGQAEQIASIRPLLDGRPTLYLGNDDFTPWLFGDVPVRSPVVAYPSLPFRPQKPWSYGFNYDIDSIEPAELGKFDWIVAPRDAASSAVPAEFRLVRSTESFDVYRRTGPVRPRFVLSEGQDPGAVLDCATPEGRRVLAGGGIAAVRGGPTGVAVTEPIEPGDTRRVQLTLTAGTWDLVSPYGGPRPVDVTGPGLRTRLPANLSRPGPRWPVGRITVTRPGPVAFTFTPTAEALTPDTALTYMNVLIAVPVGTERTVPVDRACGAYVDWYRPAG